MKFAKLAVLAVSLAAIPMTANAQDAGTVIYGSDGEPVGTVIKNTGKVAVVDTGAHQAPLPLAAMAQREDKWVIGTTKTDLDAQMAERKAKAEAALTAALVPGAALMSADKQPAGTILAVDEAADQVIVERAEGVLSLKRKHFRVSGGTLMARYKLDQIAKATKPVPEGAEIRTASGTLVRGAGGAEATEGASTTGASN